MPSLSGYGTGDGSDSGSGPPTPGDRGYRRRKFAALAGTVYRAGEKAVTEIRESYAQTRTRAMDMSGAHGRTTIPGSFPGVAITVQGDDQMVIFPSYAKRHTKRQWDESTEHHTPTPHGSIRDEDFWRREWERNQDEKAVVDVDVRGWVYSPHKGPMTRRNRILIGLARQLSGVPAPRTEVRPGQESPHFGSLHAEHEERREQEKIARKAAEIERKGREEKRIANQGGYSEAPKDDSDAEDESIYPSRSHSAAHSPVSSPSSPQFPARQHTNVSTATTELTDAELSVANANLMARLAPFLTTPLVQQPISIFFYNDERSQSRTVMTNDAGHFIMRAALDFVPTHIRVLANESLSATQEVTIIEPVGVSLISDIDDTIKRSNISAGAKEIFRNTFIRDLAGLTIEGVREWYHEMHKLGVSIHYCSNSPWQLFPVLASFFITAGLPPGSLHLKQYSGMLQGIFEPVAERKKSTLARIMKDFPRRKFLLVGDSGEADLEVYTELAVANPGRILAVFIRDVTTPEQAGYFDSAFDSGNLRKKSPSIRFQDLEEAANDPRNNRPALPPRIFDNPRQNQSVVGDLIDLSDEPEEVKLDQQPALSQISEQPKRSSTTSDLLAKKPPPRPAKPAALRSAPSDTPTTAGLGIDLGQQESRTPPQPPPPRSSKTSGTAADKSGVHPLSQMHNSSQQTVKSESLTTSNNKPPAPPPKRRETPSSITNLSPRLFSHRQVSSNNDDVEFLALPPSDVAPPGSFARSTRSRSGTRSGGSTPTLGSPTLGPAMAKKLELWKRRLASAHETLDHYGVALYTWRRGDDVIAEAVGLVKNALAEVERNKKDAKAFERQLKREQRGS
jgi:phosphatidate phosphatase APP1